MGKKILLTFADHRLWRSLRRITKQAQSFNYFDRIVALNESSLSDEFSQHYSSKLKSGSRGFGYWVWKPHIIKETLAKMEEGDDLLYIDAGCHLNPMGKKRLEEYYEALQSSRHGIIAFQAVPPAIDISPLKYDGRSLPDQSNYKYIKGDLFDYFGVRNKKEYTHSQAIGAGIILIKKCKSSVALINEWNFIIQHDFSLLDNTVSKSPNFNGFIEHRHDQAIWTLLCLKYDIDVLSAYEYWYPTYDGTGEDWNALSDFPIHVKRDKDIGPYRRFIHLVTRIINKISRLLVGENIISKKN